MQFTGVQNAELEVGHWGQSSVGRRLSSVYMPLGSIPSTSRKQRPRESSTHYYASALLAPPLSER